MYLAEIQMNKVSFLPSLMFFLVVWIFPQRCAREYKALLAEVLTADAAERETDDGKTVLNSWSTAKRLLKPDPRYNKMPRKDRETLWRRYAEDMLRKQQKSEPNSKEDKKIDPRNRTSVDSGRLPSGLRGTHERR